MNVFSKWRTFWTPVRLAITLIAFTMIASIGISSCKKPVAPPNKNALPAAILNTQLKALDGSTFKLADYAGKVVVINLWATWCGPCRSETPDLVRVSEEFKARGVEVIGLTNEDPERDVDKVRNFVKQYNVTYKIGWGDQEFALALMQGQVRNSIPQSFIISRDGEVLKRFVGFSPVETPPKLRKALEEAVNKPG